MLNDEKFLGEAIKTLQDILQIDTVESEPSDGKPFGEGNAECLNYCLKLLDGFGFKTVNLENYVGYGDFGKGELFGVLCHLDVVPVDGKWKFPPFSATIDEGKIYARGTLDNKGPAIASIYAIKRLIDEGHVFNKTVRMILGCDEESGWKCMERYNSTEKLPAMGFSPDSDFPVINCEKGLVHFDMEMKKPTNIYQFESGQRANIVPASASALLEFDEKIFNKATHLGLDAIKIDDKMQISAIGKSAHASTPCEGENALIKLLESLSDIEPFGKIFNAFYDSLGKGVGMDFPYKNNDYLTLNLGVAKIKGDKLIFSLDIRHPIDKTKEEIMQLLQKELPFFTFKIPNFHLPLYVDKNHFLVKTLCNAYSSVTGEPAETKTLGGATYARNLPLGVAFGPIFPNSSSTIHQKDEFITIDEFDKLIEIYYVAIKELTK